MNIGDFLPGADERREREEQAALEESRIKRSREALARAGGSAPGIHGGLAFATGMANQGFANHSKAADNINSAIGTEMQSRVAQAREQRRMAHEKELMQMRLQSSGRDKDADMIRALLNG